MSIFEKEPNVKNNQWHYKMLDMIYLDSEKPKTQCSYFWTVVFLIITFPLWFFSAKVDGRKEYPNNSIKDHFGMTLAVLFVFASSVWLLCGLFFLISDLLNLGIFTPDFMWVDPTIEDKEPTIWGGFFMFAGLTDLLLIILVTARGGWELLKGGVNYVSNKIDKKVSNVDVDESDEGEYTLFDSFIGWFKDTKRKVCKPINYIQSAEND